MIKTEFIKSLELSPEREAALMDAIYRDNFYRDILYKAGVIPSAIPKIMQVEDTMNIDTNNEPLYMERAKVEWSDFIRERKET